VAVIDGSRWTLTVIASGLISHAAILKLTPFKVAVIPPPFALVELQVDDNITDAALSLSGRYIFVLTNRTIHIFSWNPASKPVHPPTLQMSVPNIPDITDAFLHADGFSNGDIQLRQQLQDAGGYFSGDPKLAFRRLPYKTWCYLNLVFDKEATESSVITGTESLDAFHVIPGPFTGADNVSGYRSIAECKNVGYSPGSRSIN
jgi:hypothetical protein